MRKTILAALAVVALGGLTGCATNGDPGVAMSPYDKNVDWDTVTIITRDARQRGYDVVWVNPPTKKEKTGGIRR